MKKLLTLTLALTLILTLAAPAFAAESPDARAVVETMERFIANGGAYEQTDDLNLVGIDSSGILWWFNYYYIDFDGDGIPELVRSYMRDALQGSMDVFAARRLTAGYGAEKVASFVDDGYHLFGGGTDHIYRLGRFADGTYGVSCFMPVYAAENDGETTSESYAYYAYRDGAFYKTEENGFQEGIDFFTYGPFGAFPLSDYGACLSPQGLAVDGKEIACEKYNIFGSNYFKLRDLAVLLNGTAFQFSVDWDEETQSILIEKGKPYTPVGGELTVGADRSASAVPSKQEIKYNGGSMSGLVTAFNIGGNNYFKLRDLGALLGFTVDYDAGKNAAVVSTRRSTLADGEYHFILDGTYRYGDGGIYVGVALTSPAEMRNSDYIPPC